MKMTLFNAWVSGLCIGIAVSYLVAGLATGVTLIVFLAGILNGAIVFRAMGLRS